MPTPRPDSGVKNGQYVKLKNQDGVVSNRIRVKATQRIRPDAVYMVYGFGHTRRDAEARVRPGCRARAAPHEVRDRSADGRHELHSNFVTFVKEA